MTPEDRPATRRIQRPWSDAEEKELERLWDVHGGGFRKISAIMGRTRGSIDGKSRSMGLQFHGGRARVLEPDAPAALRATTTFHSRVVAPDANVLKTGDNQRKLGAKVKKGHWKGMPIYSLTLEERATCPRSCKQWLSCYGNGMGHAKRYEHGPDLERQISVELTALARRHRDFVVRCHILGDYHSVEYVDFWRRALATFPGLRIFGYTAWQEDTPIGAAIAHLRGQERERFAIRTSGARSGFRTIVVDRAGDAGEAIVCPAQLKTKKPISCSSCALCWATDKAIAFLRH